MEIVGAELREVAKDVLNVQKLECLALHFANAVGNGRERIKLNDRYIRPECRNTSGTFTPFLARTFESSLPKVHKITKKVGQKRSAPLGSSPFMGKRLRLLVSIHMAFVEGMLIKQMRLFLYV